MPRVPTTLAPVHAVLFAAALFASVAGCTTTVPATGVVVEIDAEPGIVLSARTLRVVVAGGTAVSREVRVDQRIEAPIPWPIHVTVTPIGGDASRTFSVSAEALDAGGGSLGTARVISGYVSRRVLFVRVVLEDCCRDTRCGGDQTCVDCSCAAATVDPTTLPDYVAGDAGPRPDARPDGGRGDAAIECTRSDECPAARPVCDGGACVECTGEDDDFCGDDEVCDEDSRTCVRTCTVDTDCETGRICTAGACVEGCRSDRPCLGDATCCNDACVDLETDPRHCGVCGTTCGTGESCCAGDCTNTSTDPLRCGTCDRACDATNGTASCAGGVCDITCDATHGDCDSDADTGCEVDLRTATDCGACGEPCAVNHGTPSCASGTCAIGSCDTGYLDCAGGVGDGCEAQVSIDPDNCGACGTNCDAASSVTACVSSTCTVVSCSTGTGNCDGLASTGCETATGTDFANCGTCGNSCTLRGTNRTCVAGTCSSIGCMPGFTDCSAAVDGCEAYLQTDRNNCGACGNVCPGGSFCDNGGCCPLGLGYCPGVGCIDTSTNPNHCGTCGHVCPAATPTCFDYDCV